MISGFGQQALISIISHLVFIAVAWWALQSVNIDKFLRGNHIFQARLLFILLSIVIGSTVSNFFLDYLLWSQQLPLIFQQNPHLWGLYSIYNHTYTNEITNKHIHENLKEKIILKYRPSYLLKFCFFSVQFSLCVIKRTIVASYTSKKPVSIEMSKSDDNS